MLQSKGRNVSWTQSLLFVNKIKELTPCGRRECDIHQNAIDNRGANSPGKRGPSPMPRKRLPQQSHHRNAREGQEWRKIHKISPNDPPNQAQR